MAAKQIVFSEDARRKPKDWHEFVANAVSATLGPKGRNVAVDRKFGSPTITHDGVSVAKEIELEDPFENMGAQLLKEAASKTNDIAGDGTTTSTVLAHAIVNEGLKALEAGFNPMSQAWYSAWRPRLLSKNSARCRSRSTPGKRSHRRDQLRRG